MKREVPKGFSPWQIAACGWLAFLIYAYPGLMTKDSFDQLGEARFAPYTDAHPPMMSAIWRVLDVFVAGPFLMVVVQTAAFVAGAFLVFRRALAPRTAALCAIALLWFPPVGAVMAVVWKDCQMAGFLMLAIGLVLDERRWLRVASLLPFLLATAVRYNAFAATLAPIVLLFVWRELPGWRRYALSSAVWLATTLAAFGCNAVLTDRQTHLWHSSLAVQDIVGTLYYTPTDISDSRLRRALAGTPLVVEHGIHAWARAHYRPDSLLDIVLGPQRLFDLSLETSAPPDQRAAIESAWKTIVKGHWAAYLRHRVEVLRATIGLVGDDWQRKIIVTHDYQDPNALIAMGVPTGYSALQSGIGAIYEWCSETWLFRPYVYLAIALVLLVLARRPSSGVPRHLQREELALLASGIVIEASLFLIGPSADYRYSHWLVVTTCAALVLVSVRRYRAGRDIGVS